MHSLRTPKYAIEFSTKTVGKKRILEGKTISVQPQVFTLAEQTVEITCQPLPEVSPTITSGATINLVTIKVDNWLICQFVTKLNLHFHPSTMRGNYQRSQLETATLTDTSWLSVLATGEDIYRAFAVWEQYRDVLRMDWQTLYTRHVSPIALPLLTDVTILLEQFMAPTNFDLGVRCKSHMRRIAQEMYGSTFASKMVQAMNSDSFIPYVSYHYDVEVLAKQSKMR